MNHDDEAKRHGKGEEVTSEEIEMLRAELNVKRSRREITPREYRRTLFAAVRDFLKERRKRKAAVRRRKLGNTNTKRAAHA